MLEFHPATEDRAPEGRELLRLQQLEVGQRYFVYVTNASGLYRYEMNDIVEVAGHDHRTPRIRFIQKGKGVVSFTGEKLYEVQVLAAVDKALAALRGRYNFIAAVAELVDGTTPRLLFLIESTPLVHLALVRCSPFVDTSVEFPDERPQLRYYSRKKNVGRKGHSNVPESEGWDSRCKIRKYPCRYADDYYDEPECEVGAPGGQ